MPFRPAARHCCLTLFALALLCTTPIPSHAVDPKFEIDPDVLAQKYASPAPPSAARPPAGAAVPREKGTGYTVQPGQGQNKSFARPRPRARAGKAARVPLRNTLQEPQTALPSEARAADAELGTARDLWTRLVPSSVRGSSDHFDYLSDTFRLSLDPQRYPTLPAQDGGSIILDGHGTLPPLIKALIQEKNARVRIVSENPANRKRFYRSLLSAAQFYSFEEGFSVHFGNDPRITVSADFKIEKSPDSLMQYDMTLLNVSQNRRATPGSLVALLARNGFQLVETGTPAPQPTGGNGDLLYQITDKEPIKIIDSLLDALDIPFETGKNIDLYARDNIGISLEVPVDRYFENNGRRYVVTLFDRDPVNYTLFRLLETKGYRVLTLQQGDDFHRIAEELLACLQLPGRYAEHDLWPLHRVGYSVRVSGALIRSRKGDGNLFLTDRSLDVLVQELAELNGYRLVGGR